MQVACRRAGMSSASAYAFRRRANGAAFALAWDGARLLARKSIADMLLDRAFFGQDETVSRPDGSLIVRRRIDNRLATHMLTRLDRYADASAAGAAGAAARLVAGEFDAFLDVLASQAAPARAALFLGTRLTDLAGEGVAADLAPVLALARADRWLRTQADGADDVAVADLVPDARADWTAEQWRRAEAAGLVALAVTPTPAPEVEPEKTLHEDQVRPLRTEPIAPEDRADPVWWCEEAEEWRTRFPPPECFMGEEDGEYGEPGYQRQLEEEEIADVEHDERAERAAREAAEGRERDRWFAACAGRDPTDDLPPEDDEEEEEDEFDEEDFADDDLIDEDDGSDGSGSPVTRDADASGGDGEPDRREASGPRLLLHGPT